MKKNSWIETHPFKMAFIVTTFLLIYSVGIYGFRTPLPDWNSFLMWSPIVGVLPFGAATMSHFSEKLKT